MDLELEWSNQVSVTTNTLPGMSKSHEFKPRVS